MEISLRCPHSILVNRGVLPTGGVALGRVCAWSLPACAAGLFLKTPGLKKGGIRDMTATAMEQLRVTLFQPYVPSPNCSSHRSRGNMGKEQEQDQVQEMEIVWG